MKQLLIYGPNTAQTSFLGFTNLGIDSTDTIFFLLSYLKKKKRNYICETVWIPPEVLSHSGELSSSPPSALTSPWCGYTFRVLALVLGSSVSCACLHIYDCMRVCVCAHAWLYFSWYWALFIYRTCSSRESLGYKRAFQVPWTRVWSLQSFWKPYVSNVVWIFF